MGFCVAHDEERLLERVDRPADGDRVLLHGLEQGRLRLGGGPVDLVGQGRSARRSAPRWKTNWRLAVGAPSMTTLVPMMSGRHQVRGVNWIRLKSKRQRNRPGSGSGGSCPSPGTPSSNACPPTNRQVRNAVDDCRHGRTMEPWEISAFTRGIGIPELRRRGLPIEAGSAVLMSGSILVDGLMSESGGGGGSGGPAADSGRGAIMVNLDAIEARNGKRLAPPDGRRRGEPALRGHRVGMSMDQRPRGGLTTQ